MKLTSFSTLGCPGTPIPAVVALAEQYGIDGVELLCADGEPVHPGMTDAERSAVRDQLGPIRLLALCGYVRLGAAGSDDDVVAAMLADAATAAALGGDEVVGVRVFPGDSGVGTEVMARRLRTAAAQLPPGVELWLETHDTHSRGEDLAEVLAQADAPGTGAIWDLAHPWAAGEQPETTAAALGPWLRHVQIKDEDASRSPMLTGQGVLPLTRLLDAAEQAGARTLGLEWERKWHPEIAELSVALEQTVSWLDAHSD